MRWDTWGGVGIGISGHRDIRASENQTPHRRGRRCHTCIAGDESGMNRLSPLESWLGVPRGRVGDRDIEKSRHRVIGKPKPFELFRGFRRNRKPNSTAKGGGATRVSSIRRRQVSDSDPRPARDYRKKAFTCEFAWIVRPGPAGILLPGQLLSGLSGSG